MARFDSAIALADRLITRSGETSTLRRNTPGTPPDPARPYEPGPTVETNTDVKAVWLDYELGRIDGQLIKRGDQRVLIPAKGLTITPDASLDVLVRADGTKWTIVNVETLAPNGQLILHTAQVRQ